jgi:hypothetical protein
MTGKNSHGHSGAVSRGRLLISHSRHGVFFFSTGEEGGDITGFDMAGVEEEG